MDLAYDAILVRKQKWCTGIHSYHVNLPLLL